MEHELIATVLLLIAILLGPIVLLSIMLWFTVNVSIRIGQWFWRSYRSKTTPCGNCLYYTGHQQLACAVNPCMVLTKNAKSCQDFLLVEAVSRSSFKKQSKRTH